MPYHSVWRGKLARTDGITYGALMEITRGTPVQVRTAAGELLPRRALGEIARGEDFPVVWVCRDEEWDTALLEGREPQGVPWPAEDVRIATEAAA